MGVIKHHKTLLNNTGSVLISLIITMVVLAALGAAMVSLTSTSMFGQVGANSSARAYYLAESGYRYAESRYLNADGSKEKDRVLEEDLHGKTFTLLDNAGRFELKVYPYYFKLNADIVGGTTTTLNTRVPGGFPLDLTLATGSTGRMKIGSKDANIYNYTVDSQIGNNVTFTISQTLPNFEEDTDVLPVAQSSSSNQTINEGDTLLLQTGNANAFPRRNGTFQINDKVYAYKENDTANNQLLGISVPNVFPMPTLTVAANSDIVLKKFVKLHSTGMVGQGAGEGAASREVVYHVPLPSAGDERKEFWESFEDLTNWKPSTLGTFAIQTIGGDKALRVTGTGSLGGTLTGSLIRFDPSALNIDLPAAHIYGDPYFLSYDAQVKIGFYPDPTPGGGFDPPPIPKYFAGGISFRLDNDNNSYGLSFLRGDNTDTVIYDNIDNNIVPLDRKMLIVLWQGTGSGNTRKWLAYKKDLALFFKDDMESGTNGWTVTGNGLGVAWHQSTGQFSNRVKSPTMAWRYGRQDGQWTYNNDAFSRTTGELESPSIDLTQATSATLTFWTWFLTTGTPLRDQKHVEVNDGTGWVGLTGGNPIPADIQSLHQRSYDLSDYCGKTIKIRFRFDSYDGLDNNLEGWYIDDVRIAGHMAASINEATLAVRVKEAASVAFTSGTYGGGSAPIENLDTVVGLTSGARGVVAETSIISSGSWASNNAAGTLILKNTVGTFSSGEQIQAIGSAAAATVSAYRPRDNFIRAYYGTAGGYGTPDSNPLNDEKKANPRGSVNWPPDELADWSATNDYFTLIRWDAVNTGVTVVPSVNEPGAIIQDNTSVLLSPSSGPLLKPELGLHTFGRGSTNVYFDDLAVQADVGAPGNTGFVRTVQE